MDKQTEETKLARKLLDAIGDDNHLQPIELTPEEVEVLERLADKRKVYPGEHE